MLTRIKTWRQILAWAICGGLIAASVALAAPPAARSNWPVFRGDALGTGVAGCDLPEKLQVLWKFEPAKRSFESAAAIVDGVVYVGDRGNVDGKVYALKLADGSKLWEFPAEANFVAPAAVRDGRVFIGDLYGKFYCLDAASGKQLWSHETSGEIDGGANFWNGNVLIGSQDASLYCLNEKTGKLVWSYAIADQIRCSPTIVEDRAFVAGCDGSFHIIDLKEGKEIGSVPLQSPTGSTPAVVGQRAFFGAQSGVFFAIDWKKAETVWTDTDRSNTQPFDGSAAASEKLGLVIVAHDKKVHGYDPAKGDEKWFYKSRSSMTASAVIAGERAYLGTHDGRLIALNARTGKEASRLELTGKILASPAVADGRLVIGTDAGVLYCLGEK